MLFLDGAARALAGACVGPGTLPAHRQSAAMPYAAVAAQIHQALDVHGNLTAQVALDLELRHFGAQGVELAFRQLPHLGLSLLAGIGVAMRTAASGRELSGPHPLAVDGKPALRDQLHVAHNLPAALQEELLGSGNVVAGLRTRGDVARLRAVGRLAGGYPHAKVYEVARRLVAAWK